MQLGNSPSFPLASGHWQLCTVGSATWTWAFLHWHIAAHQAGLWGEPGKDQEPPQAWPQVVHVPGKGNGRGRARLDSTRTRCTGGPCSQATPSSASSPQVSPPTSRLQRPLHGCQNPPQMLPADHIEGECGHSLLAPTQALPSERQSEGLLLSLKHRTSTSRHSPGGWRTPGPASPPSEVEGVTSKQRERQPQTRGKTDPQADNTWRLSPQHHHVRGNSMGFRPRTTKETDVYTHNDIEVSDIPNDSETRNACPRPAEEHLPCVYEALGSIYT